MAKIILAFALVWELQAAPATFVSREEHFRVKHPAQLQVHVSTATDHEKHFDFAEGNAHPLRLRVVDLSKYLPKTNTPTVKEYVQTFKTFPKYKETQIGSKPAYEYSSCGRGACDEEVVFIHGNRMYDFSIAAPGTIEIRAIVNSIEFD